MYPGDIRKDEGRVVTVETVNDLFDSIVSKPATVTAASTLRQAVDAILDSGITRKCYVVDTDGKLRGTITIQTLMRHVAYRLGARPPGVISWFRFLREIGSEVVTDFMAKPVVVTRQTVILDIVRRVVEENLNDFPLVDEQGKLIGEVNTYDLLKATRGAFSKE